MGMAVWVRIPGIVHGAVGKFQDVHQLNISEPALVGGIPLSL